MARRNRKKEEENNTLRGGYDPEEMKARWLKDFNNPKRAEQKHAEILKRRYYKYHTVTVQAIYMRLWRWTKDAQEEKAMWTKKEKPEKVVTKKSVDSRVRSRKKITESEKRKATAEALRKHAEQLDFKVAEMEADINEVREAANRLRETARSLEAMNG